MRKRSYVVGFLERTHWEFHKHGEQQTGFESLFSAASNIEPYETCALTLDWAGCNISYGTDTWVRCQCPSLLHRMLTAYQKVPTDGSVDTLKHKDLPTRGHSAERIPLPCHMSLTASSRCV